MRPSQLAVVMLLQASTLPAQGRISGVVHDSLLTGAPLPRATVVVVGTMISVATDEKGRFRLDSVPAGRHQLTFFHELLDSIGVAPSSVDVDVLGNNDESVVQLWTPSRFTLRRVFCPFAMDSATGLLIGKVRDVDTGEAIPNASVSTSWMELRFDTRPRAETQRASTTSLGSGAFVLCGVPTDVPVFVRASLENQTSGFVEIYGQSRAVFFHHLSISLSDTASRLSVDSTAEATTMGLPFRPPGSATLAGRVQDSDGRPIARARVSLHVGGAATEADNHGNFRLSGLPAGTQTLDLRAVGFTPARRAVDLKSNSENTHTLQLDRRAVALPGVHVIGSMRLARSGFFERERAGHGRFLREEDIERMSGAMAIDILQRAPGLFPKYYRVQGRTVRGVSMRRSGPGECAPNLFIDGFTWPGAWDQLMNFIHKTEVVAVEVYSSVTSTPIQFDRGNGCGAVVIWTRP